MDRYRLHRDSHGRVRLDCPVRGSELIRHPIYTKGTAFPEDERRAFGLDGLLPSKVTTIEEQARRMYASIVRKPEPLEKFIGLAALQERNETLFFRVLLDHLEEFLPIVYTPTVGQACKDFSRIFRRARGIWITPEHRGRVAEVLGFAPFEDVRLIVATDNARILGLGDQGAGGMGIPIGKLALYTAAAGIPPWQTLPISLDVGTDNEALLADEFYLGYRERRLRGPAYDSLIEEFVEAVKARFPRALLQWEDFKSNAFDLLDRYRQRICSFNDDIQGTAAMAVAGIMAGTRVSGVPLPEQRVVVLGAGAAGIGIARLLRATLQRAGLEGDALAAAIACVDIQGLLVDDAPTLDAPRRAFAWPAPLAARLGFGPGRPRDLLAVVRALKPTVLVGTSGQPGTFSEAVVREMARHCARPMILPMSNPTSQSEAIPEDVIAWTEGRALVATGSPFEPVTFEGRRLVIGQGNNAFVFPGVGLGAIVCEAREVTDGMFQAAADRLALEVQERDLLEGSLFPRVAELRRLTAVIAEAVVREAIAAGVAGRVLEDAAIGASVRGAMWEPTYVPLNPV
jgi:malic enzyme